MRPWFGKIPVLAGVLLLLFVLAMPIAAEAHFAASDHAEESVSVQVQSGRFSENPFAIDGHCHPGVDCQTVFLFLHQPVSRLAHARIEHRFRIRRSDPRSRIVSFDLPPPRTWS